VNTLADATVRLPRSGLVVWLDELHRFLAGPHLTAGAAGLLQATVRKLPGAPRTTTRPPGTAEPANRPPPTCSPATGATRSIAPATSCARSPG
jgi:hypothetical protein